MQKIQTYKLPFYKRFAHAYNFYKNIAIVVISLVLALVIYYGANNTTWGMIFFISALVVLVYSLVQFGRNVASELSFQVWATKTGRTSDHVGIGSGAPGTGKTLYENMATYYMAKYSWRELQFEYWLLIPKISKPGYVPTDDDKEIIEAYEFYTNNEGIPCLSSNSSIYSHEYKRFSYEVTEEHLKQEKRVPYRITSALDEIGTICNMELYKDRSNNFNGSADMSDEFRFCRQHAEWRMTGTEQEASNIFKDVRRVVANIIKFRGVEKVMKPPFLNWLYNKLKDKFIEKSSDRQAKRWARFMSKFKRFLNNTGYLKITYTYITESIDSKGESTYSESTRKNGKPFVVYFPCALPIEYETRAFRKSYKALEKPIEMRVFKDLRLTKEQASKMLKSVTLKVTLDERNKLKQLDRKEAEKAKLEAKIEAKKKQIEELKKFKEEMKQNATTSKKQNAGDSSTEPVIRKVE